MKYFLHQISDPMHIFIADLDKAGPGFVKEVASKEESVAEIGKVGVDTEFPGVAEGADHFGLLGEVFVLAVFDIAAVDERLEIGPVADAVRRIDVNHLDLPGHAFFFEEGVHYKQGVTGDQSVGPAMGVAVEVHGFAERGIFFAGFEEVALRGLECDTVALADGFDDGTRVDTFVDMERNGGNFKGGVFGFARPDELRVEMGIVSVGFAGSNGWIGLRSDEADRGIVDAGFGFVIVLLDGTFCGVLFGFGRRLFVAGHKAYLELIFRVEEIVLWDYTKSQWHE